MLNALLKRWKVFVPLLFIAILAIVLWQNDSSNQENLITTTVEKGTVTELVSVSGFIEAKNTADLSFPVTGKVTEVFVEEGMEVEAGEVLATQAASQLVAERNQALANLQSARAAYDETISGPTETDRAVSETAVTNANANLEQTTVEYQKKVDNARAILLSSDLEAVAVNSSELASPPSISGTYKCDEGVYNIEVYRSGSLSGYSYRTTGIEKTTGPAYVDQPAPVGNCGLYIQFVEGENYSNSNWTISIPNKRGASYNTNLNTYELAIKQRDNAVAAAENSLTLAEREAAAATASARSETITQKRSDVSAAQARIAAIDAQIADRSIVAPFNGIITNVSVLPGETVGGSPVITILAEDAFELVARIPEIDITKVTVGQKTEVVFDASSNNTFTGEITFVSPLATEIDGVAYFETTINLEEIPDWIRSGLNADIEIIIKSLDNVLRLPKRFVVNEDGISYVTILDNQDVRKAEVTIVESGNDGYLAIEGLKEGQVVIAP